MHIKKINIVIFIISILVYPASILADIGINNPYMHGAQSAGRGNTYVASLYSEFSLNNNAASIGFSKDMSIDLMSFQLYNLPLNYISAEFDKNIFSSFSMAIGLDALNNYDSECSLYYFVEKIGLSYTSEMSSKSRYSFGIGLFHNDMFFSEDREAVSYEKDWLNYTFDFLFLKEEMISSKDQIILGIRLHNLSYERAYGITYKLSEYDFLISYQYKNVGKAIHSFGFEKNLFDILKLRTGAENQYFHTGLSYNIADYFIINYAFGLNPINKMHIISFNIGL